jgi:hypothetical protein
VIRAALPDANVPTSIRDGKHPVFHGAVTDIGGILQSWLAGRADGVAGVISADGKAPAGVPLDPRIRCLTPVLAKGLEFDLVVLLAPNTFGDGIEGTVDRYVAMTRATDQLAILTL